MSKTKQKLIEEICDTYKEIEIQRKKNDKLIKKMLPKLSIKDLKEELMLAGLELWELQDVTEYE